MPNLSVLPVSRRRCCWHATRQAPARIRAQGCPHRFAVSRCKPESCALLAAGSRETAAPPLPLGALLVSLGFLGEGLWSNDSLPSHGSCSAYPDNVGLSSPTRGWEPRGVSKWGIRSPRPSITTNWSHNLGQALPPLGPGLLHNKVAPDRLLQPLERNLWYNEDIKRFPYILTATLAVNKPVGDGIAILHGYGARVVLWKRP